MPLIFRYGSLQKALEVVYPDKSQWPISVPPPDTPGYWNDTKHQLEFFNRLAWDLKLKNLEDWYSVKRSDLTKKGASVVLSRHGNSLSKTLINLYPKHDWQPWKFEVIPRGLWDDPKIQRSFFDSYMKEAGFKNMEDWYNVKESDIRDKGGSSLLSYHKNSLAKALAEAFPDYNWHLWKFGSVPGIFAFYKIILLE